VDVDDTPGERAEEFPFEDAHEAGQHDEIDATAGQELDQLRFSGFVQFGSVFPRWDEFAFDPSLPGLLQDAGISHVAYDDRDLGGDYATGTGIRNGGEIRAFARTQYCQPKLLAAHRVLIQPWSKC
jgi:hypothetical protein